MTADSPSRRPVDDWNGTSVAPGERRNVQLPIGESYSGMTVQIPIHIRRASEPGPAVFVTAALHGDEINGTGAVRNLIQDQTLNLVRGTLILVPVLNLLSFDRHSRYLPDRRDLNRCFPGSETGSLASRMARTIFDQIVMRCDYGIDLHTAAVRRTNYPTVRGDLSIPEVRRIAEAFATYLELSETYGSERIRRHDDSQITVGVDDVALYPDQAVPLSLLVTETVTNALKYVGRPSNAAPWIELTLREETDGSVELQVANSTGPYVNEEAQVSTGLGQQLMAAFAMQLDAEMSIEDENDAYIVKVTFNPSEFAQES